jgi:hypothetical protein
VEWRKETCVVCVGGRVFTEDLVPEKSCAWQSGSLCWGKTLGRQQKARSPCAGGWASARGCDSGGVYDTSDLMGWVVVGAVGRGIPPVQSVWVVCARGACGCWRKVELVKTSRLNRTTQTQLFVKRGSLFTNTQSPGSCCTLCLLFGLCLCTRLAACAKQREELARVLQRGHEKRHVCRC